MDQIRQIRFAIPPFFLLFILFWNASCERIDLSKLNDSHLSTLIAAAAAAIPFGFAISSISIGFLALFFPKYEAKISDFDGLFRTLLNSVNRIPSVPPATLDKKQVLYAVATFDHSVLPKGINEWLGRRWTFFNVGVHSSWAIVLGQIISLVALPCSGLNERFIKWSICPSFILVFILLYNAVRARRQTMEMLDFQVTLRSLGAPRN